MVINLLLNDKLTFLEDFFFPRLVLWKSQNVSSPTKTKNKRNNNKKASNSYKHSYLLLQRLVL